MKIQTGQPDPITVQPKAVKMGTPQNPTITESSTPMESTVQPQVAATNQEIFTSTQNAQMLEKIHNQPEIRPEVLAKAQQLVADPNYPPANLIAKLASLLINSDH